MAKLSMAHLRAQKRLFDMLGKDSRSDRQTFATELKESMDNGTPLDWQGMAMRAAEQGTYLKEIVQHAPPKSIDLTILAIHARMTVHFILLLEAAPPAEIEWEKIAEAVTSFNNDAEIFSRIDRLEYLFKHAPAGTFAD